jgi:hypothetical protein
VFFAVLLLTILGVDAIAEFAGTSARMALAALASLAAVSAVADHNVVRHGSLADISTERGSDRHGGGTNISKPSLSGRDVLPAVLPSGPSSATLLSTTSGSSFAASRLTTAPQRCVSAAGFQLVDPKPASAYSPWQTFQMPLSGKSEVHERDGVPGRTYRSISTKPWRRANRRPSVLGARTTVSITWAPSSRAYTTRAGRSARRSPAGDVREVPARSLSPSSRPPSVAVLSRSPPPPRTRLRGGCAEHALRFIDRQRICGDDQIVDVLPVAQDGLATNRQDLLEVKIGHRTA